MSEASIAPQHCNLTSVSPKAVNWAEGSRAYDGRERGISSTCPDKNIASAVENNPLGEDWGWGQAACCIPGGGMWREIVVPPFLLHYTNFR